MNTKTGRRLTLVLSLALVSAPLLAESAPAPPDDGRWHFAFSPYLWATSQEGDASFKGIPPQHIEMSFSDIWENLDFAALGAFEARKGRWGAATDLVFMNLGATIPHQFLGQPSPSVDSRQFVLEGDVLFRVHQGAGGGLHSYVDLLAGARYNKVRAGLDTSLVPDTERSFDWVDGLVGARAQVPLSRKVAIGVRGDVAGLGSDFTWQARADLRVQLSEHWGIGVGYRYIDTDYDEGAGTERKLWSMVNKGPYLGVQIGW